MNLNLSSWTYLSKLYVLLANVDWAPIIQPSLSGGLSRFKNESSNDSSFLRFKPGIAPEHTIDAFLFTFSTGLYLDLSSVFLLSYTSNNYEHSESCRKCMPAKIPCYIFRLELEFVVDNDLRNEPKNQVLCCTNQSLSTCFSCNCLF